MARLTALNVGKVTNDSLFVLNGVPFVAPVKARRPLVKQWWEDYRARSAKAARSLAVVYVFHYHLRLMFPKERGILSAYGSSLVPLAKDEYYTSRKYRALCNRVRKRDKSCVLCNVRYRLQVHHRTYNYWGNEDPSELTALCRDCHEAFHKRPSWVSPSNKNVLYVWSKPTSTRRHVPMGITTDLAVARRERDRIWGKR